MAVLEPIFNPGCHKRVADDEALGYFSFMASRSAAFFFGSGISFPTGMPSVSELTNAALNGSWYRHTDQNFYPGTSGNPALVDGTTQTVKDFLKQVHELCAEYLAILADSCGTRDPHYEDYFSLSEQASRIQLDSIPNLAVVEFQRRLRETTADLHQSFTGGPIGVDGFIGLAETACEYLHCVVHHSLSQVHGPPKGLEVLSEAADGIDEIDIFTLNHDCLVEKQLASTSPESVNDGFGDRSRGEFRVFNGWSQTSRQERVRLFKLHGSLNWYLYDFPGWARQYAIPNGDPYHSKDADGNLVNPVEWKAAFLSGTVVKEQRYGLGFWGTLINAFREHLSRHAHLICCGYGFGDVGINQRLHQWAHDRLDQKNKIVLLTPEEPDQFLRSKPYWLRDLWDKNQLIFVPRYLQDCSMDDLDPYLD